VSDAVSQLQDALITTTRERPYLSVAAAASVGYVLGGGLPGWTIRLALGVVVRAAANAAVRQALAAVTEPPNNTQETHELYD
jgi:hypothetical protein